MNIQEFKQNLPKHKAILGFDYGDKRLGVAVSDLMWMVATPYKIIQRKDFKTDMAEIQKIIEEKEVGAIVYGLPLQMNGEEGETAAKVRAFAEKVFAQTHLPFMFWDERLSSSAMERFLISELDMSRRRRKQVLDSSAAGYILQGVLDSINRV